MTLLRVAYVLALVTALLPRPAVCAPAGAPDEFPDGGDGLEMVGEGVVSTAHHEWTPSLTPDGRTLFFGVADPSFVTATRFWTIAFARRGGEEGDGWQAPEIAPFSGGRSSDGYPAVSPDGTRLFFASDRGPSWPEDDSTGEARRDFDLWVVERVGDGWGEPRRLGPEINTGADELAPAVTADGTLYFASDRPGGAGGFDLYRARPAGEGYGTAEPLGAPVASAGDERDLWIAPDGALLLFSSRGLPGGLGSDDLWVSRRQGDGWSTPRNLGAPVSSPASDTSPWLSGDGATLYFASRRGFGDAPSDHALSYAELEERLRSVRNGGGNLYQIPTARVPALAAALSVSSGSSSAVLRPLPAPVLIGPGVVSSREFEGHQELAPDGKSLYFTIYNRAFDRDTIVVSHLEDGAWSRPEVASFSGRWSDVSTGISPDGERLVFSSRRPRPDEPARTDLDLWVVEKEGDGWGAPRNPGPPVNTPADDYSPVFTRDGTLFFCSNRPGGLGGYDVYRAEASADEDFGEPENLGPPVNTEHAEWNVGVSPEGDLLVFMVHGRADAVGGDDLYASRLEGGRWGEPVNLRELNTPDNDYSPKVSPDGRYLLFGSNTFPRRARRSYAELVEQLDGVLNGAGNIYRVDLEVVLRRLGEEPRRAPAP